MRTLAAVVVRELYTRWHLPVAAVLLGVMAWAAVWLPQVSRFDAEEVRSATAMVMSVVLLTGAAIVLGTTLVSRGLSEGRLAFFYVRPISAASLWCGKFIAAVLLLAAAAAGVWLPTLASGGSPAIAMGSLFEWPEKLRTFAVAEPPWNSRGHVMGSISGLLSTQSYELSPGPLWLWTTLALVILLLAAHVVATVLRAKSPRLLIDLILLAVTVALAWDVASRLAYHGIQGTLYRCAMASAVAVTASLFVAGQAQLTFARTSVRRGHTVASIAVWGVLLPFVLSLEVLSMHRLAAGLEDYAALTHMVTAPRGDWIVVAGPARGETGYAPVLAYHPPTGARHKLDVVQALPGSPVFSSDGRRLVWESCGALWGSSKSYTPRTLWPSRHERWHHCEVRYLDLGSPDAEPIDTGIRTSLTHARMNFLPNLALAADGHRLALVAGGRLSVYELPSGKVVGAVELGEDKVGMPLFTGPRLRLCVPAWATGRTRVLDFDAERRRLTEVGHLPGTVLRWDLERELLASWSFKSGVHVVQGGSLEEAFTYPPDPDKLVYDVRFLTDSGFLIAEKRLWESSRVRRFDASGQELWAMELPLSSVILGGEAAPGRIWLGVQSLQEKPPEPEGGSEEPSFLRWATGATHWHSRLVDLGTGRVLLEKPELVPNWHEAGPGSPGARVMVGRHGRLLLADPEDGSVEVLLELSGSD